MSVTDTLLSVTSFETRFPVGIKEGVVMEATPVVLPSTQLAPTTPTSPESDNAPPKACVDCHRHLHLHLHLSSGCSAQQLSPQESERVSIF